ncbi:MAG: ABC transporter substrate-binding protein [Microcella sp.]
MTPPLIRAFTPATCDSDVTVRGSTASSSPSTTANGSSASSSRASSAFSCRNSVESYVENDSVADLTDFANDNPDLLDRYLPSILQNGQFGDKTVGLPMNKVNPAFIWYNKAIFDEAGVEPPQTWDELLDLIPTFKAAGIAPFALGGQSKWPSLIWLEYLVDRLGGSEVFDRIAAGDADAWSDPAILEAAEMIQDLVKAGGFIDNFSSIPSTSGSELALMYTGKAAMVLQLSSQYQTMKDSAPDFVASGDLGWVPFPTVEGGTGDPGFLVGTPANFFSVSTQASEAQQDTAKRFLAENVLNEDYVQGIIDTGAVPPVVGIEDEIAASPDGDYLGYVYDLVKDSPRFQLSWDQALTPEQADTMLTNLEQLFLLSITPQQFADTMNGTL